MLATAERFLPTNIEDISLDDDDFVDPMEIEDVEEGGDKSNEVEDMDKVVDTDKVEEEESDDNWIDEEHPAVILESRSNESPLEVNFEAAGMPDETLKRSLDIYHFARKNGVSRNVFDSIIKMVNNHIKSGGSCLYTHYKARKEQLKRYPVKPKSMMFARKDVSCMMKKMKPKIVVTVEKPALKPVAVIFPRKQWFIYHYFSNWH